MVAAAKAGLGGRDDGEGKSVVGFNRGEYGSLGTDDNCSMFVVIQNKRRREKIVGASASVHGELAVSMRTNKVTGKAYEARCMLRGKGSFGAKSFDGKASEGKGSSVATGYVGPASVGKGSFDAKGFKRFERGNDCFASDGKGSFDASSVDGKAFVNVGSFGANGFDGSYDAKVIVGNASAGKCSYDDKSSQLATSSVQLPTSTYNFQ